MMSGTPGSQPHLTLWMGDLDYYMTEEWLTQLFASMRHSVRVKVIRDKTTQQIVGYGFVEFATSEEAKYVLETYTGKEIPNTGGRMFKLNWASTGDKTTDESVFIGDLSSEISDYLLLKTFRDRFPSVTSAKVVVDQFGRSKNYGFVRFSDADESQRAILEMNGMLLGSRNIRVCEANSKRPPGATPTASSSVPPPSVDVDPTNTMVFVGGINEFVSEDELRSAFEPFGEMISLKALAGRGYAFIDYARHEDAGAAIVAMNGSTLGGSRLRVNWGKTPSQKRQQQHQPHMYAGGGAMGGGVGGMPGGGQWGGYYGGYYGTPGGGYASSASGMMGGPMGMMGGGDPSAMGGGAPAYDYSGYYGGAPTSGYGGMPAYQTGPTVGGMYGGGGASAAMMTTSAGYPPSMPTSSVSVPQPSMSSAAPSTLPDPTSSSSSSAAAMMAPMGGSMGPSTAGTMSSTGMPIPPSSSVPQPSSTSGTGEYVYDMERENAQFIDSHEKPMIGRFGEATGVRAVMDADDTEFE
eukprot:TRINITY_DN80204_c0_g1_i1.p1 TRINITY_DN80204_c0_g1~~TRINITY_DN80204_c0_g1_i1.p1  ORF type:complete len:521 (-),score=163.84 TRINITY_DN80204_c0_g1_i1:272-1834(-)